MDKIFIFDVDGTLTPSRRKMTQEFQEFFYQWSKKNRFYLVTGSDLPKIQEQTSHDILELADGIFTCCGNQFWQESLIKEWPTNWRLIYENKFKPPKNLIKYLEEQLKKSAYHHRAGNHIEDRGSMVNFSIVGRNCSVMERKNYFKWDGESKERKIISKYIRKQWPDLDAVIGGEISIDIYPKGMDKSQIFDVIKQERLVQPSEYIFIGDRTQKGGNDYPLAKLMNKTDSCSTFQTNGWEHTMQILEKLSD